MIPSPRSFLAGWRPESQIPPDIPPLVAAEIAQEYASLRAPNGCPKGMFLVPTEETLLRWHGVLFLHHGPYSGSILRFTVGFPSNYPQSGPTVRFNSDVFHPLVDARTKIWHPRGNTVQWRPKVDHVSRLLHELKISFSPVTLDLIEEGEAVNKHVWSLYQHSRQTFISMTAQRAVHSASQAVLFPAAYPQTPSSTTPPRRRQASMNSLSSDDGPNEPVISFKEVNLDEKEQLLARLRRAYECDK
ncbi:hypothetical protein C343_00278 [Cryptococcus neoformans C23]|uniref:UBC core domain-containing protein n=1 Tax=Cryptococcus neoformans (strain H99 / ATCC 208821 / CBS 10515 / FGSC 9487) TaxID=235443 RepID=J9VIL1_CRYN9|nr:hypothetical protein CNAG_00276 [Cryptococcus neoformans var. grubii H99]AUB21837.1 hypothetical protein CKF44_00276 [Cryptococcus neoformans var. grubii]OWZ36995.1 hypothetical protein C347_00355 [Cryptococcus neoformans var. grubii AD2-60a]OWZ48826.1 hypothetical protein C343_00278 [Cryptococcus neoformans var. grubii C23]OXC87340.1 hypothetical protein C344_00290 [Cryptococcus neoformans var. grubii AD1-7a]AFR92409.1 hypothetical protein CNAG_00276 [Cryptococcus neoformans var. grubii H9|eukprot:XP_012046627.1 hypothetical protein CNAG_00276 [Cryptococcus neoformans var. grubii H99]